MQSSSGRWTRRQFVRVTAGAAAAVPMHRVFASQRGSEIAGFAYATSHENGEQGRIHVYAVRNDRWTPVETLPSEAPAFSCVSADGRTLYVANEASEAGGLPRGSVTAYRIGADGRLTLLGGKALSLAAMRPKHLALSPDGTSLVVAASGGGIYNTISIHEDGSLGGITAIRKDTGCGPHATQASSHPHTVLFDDRTGWLLASDNGNDRVSLFEQKNDKLVRRQMLSMDAGSGPGSLALGSNALYIRHTLSNRIDVYRYDGSHGVGEKLQSVLCDAGQALTLDAGRRTLYASGKDLLAWSVKDDGELGPAKAMRGISAHRLVPAIDGRVLFAVDSSRGEIRQVTLNAQTGEPTKVQDVVQSHARWTSLSVLTV
ncbi:lactonase family protein [Silvibacterium acidisoli]|uniref:lactonase family protein n=1 Tax=Acidobacteriaceae bacterium ZG23-2 TaxID=2883246 RepID=UPI00406C9D81